MTVVGSGQTTPRQHVLGRLMYSQSRGTRLLRRTVAVLLLVLGVAALRTAVGSLLPPRVYEKDILQGYTLARAIVDGTDPYLPVDVLAARYVGELPGTALAHPTPHPPTLGLLLLPLSLLDYSTAAIVWFVLQILCLAASVYLLGRVAGARLSVWATLAIATALLTWYPMPVEMVLGQLMVVILALLAGGWLALRSSRPVLAGALVGLSMLIKPVAFPVLLLFLLRRNWPALAGAGLVIFGGYLAAAAVVGLDTVEMYFTSVLPLVAGTYRASWGNISLWTLGWRFFHGTGTGGRIVAPPVVASATAAHVASIGLPGLVLLLACLVVRRQRSLDVSLVLMICVSILVSPISWNHYVLLAVIPAAQVLRWLLRHDLPPRETNLALVVAMLLVVDWAILATLLAIQVAVAQRTTMLPTALAQLPLMTTVAVGALAWLVARLGPADTRTPATGD